ncbi:MAG: hypothetical protein KZQ83_05470 [gamma proteobacterium symbiont of Taylorina sp.]|nr:hypothetical protein [gamma proteobacterium symbiont of Taylorina sp.]
MKDWFYNEDQHVGVDYLQKETAQIYDKQKLIIFTLLKQDFYKLKR